MMTQMVNFFTAMLSAVAAWLGSEPIIWLFGLTCLLGICKAVKILLPS